MWKTGDTVYKGLDMLGHCWKGGRKEEPSVTGDGEGDHPSEGKGSKERLKQSSWGLEEGQSAEGVKAIEGLRWECGGGRGEGGSGFREISVVALTRLGNPRAWRGGGRGVRDNLKVSSWDDEMQDGTRCAGEGAHWVACGERGVTPGAFISCVTRHPHFQVEMCRRELPLKV